MSITPGGNPVCEKCGNWYGPGIKHVCDENCGVCYACIGNEPAYEGSWLTVGMTRMIVCAECGNKRCPHGTDHRYACTGSNELNQEGSRYQYDPHPPCCTACDGKGADMSGPCSDCYGTGHAHES